VALLRKQFDAGERWCVTFCLIADNADARGWLHVPLGADLDLVSCDPGDIDPHAVASLYKAYLRERMSLGWHTLFNPR
jgi:hypothetical protein